MRFLFVHQNFPGQYVHIARHLAQIGHEVSFITQPRPVEIEGIRKIEYRPTLRHSDTHAYLHDLENGVANGLAVAKVCHWLDRDGYIPDIVIGHNGWGEILYVKDVWPQTPLLGYFEFFYRPSGSDIDFDPEFPPEADIAMRLRTRNAVNLLGLDADPDQMAAVAISQALLGSDRDRTRGNRYGCRQAGFDGASMAEQRALPFAAARNHHL
jgi:hypothetical protein